MAHRAAGRGSGDGINRAILEARLGSAGAILEAELSESGRCRPDVRNTTSGAGVVQSWAARAQDRLSRCRTFGETARIAGANLELRARCRTVPVANTNAHKVSTDAKYVCRINWRHCLKKPISSCPVWFQISWVPVHVVRLRCEPSDRPIRR